MASMENTERDKVVAIAQQEWDKLHVNMSSTWVEKDEQWSYYMKAFETAWELCIQQQCQIRWSDNDIMAAVDYALGYGYNQGFNDGSADEPVYNMLEEEEESKKIAEDWLQQYKATHTPLHQEKRYTEEDVHKLLIKWIEACGEYHVAEDIIIMTKVIREYKDMHCD